LLTNIFGGYTPMFVASAVMAVVALLSLLLLDIPPAKRNEEPDYGKAARRRGLGELIQLSVVPLGAVLFLVYLGYSGILSFITLYSAEIGLSEAVSFYFVVYAVVILITRPPVGRRVDRKGENSVIYSCFIALALGFVVLAFAKNAFMLLASAALVGFGIGATQSIVQATIARDTPQDELGRANSTFFMSMDLGSGVGPIIIGAIIPIIGYSASYIVLAVLGILAGVLYHFAHGRKQKR
jgi:predicted MFS family arabinose efflux permease